MSHQLREESAALIGRGRFSCHLERSPQDEVERSCLLENQQYINSWNLVPCTCKQVNSEIFSLVWFGGKSAIIFPNL